MYYPGESDSSIGKDISFLTNPPVMNYNSCIQKYAMKRNSTDGKHYRERMMGVTSLCGTCGTRLGASVATQRKPALTAMRWVLWHQLGWYRRVFGPFEGFEGSFYLEETVSDPIFREKEREKWQTTKKW